MNLLRSHRGSFPSHTPSDKAAITIDSTGRSRMEPESRLRRDSGWRSWQFMFTLVGSGVGTVGDQAFAAEPGDVLIMPKDRGHRYQARPGAEQWIYLWIEFDGACVPALLTMFSLSGRVAVPGCAAVGALVEQVHRSLAEHGDAALHEATALLMQIFAGVERSALAPTRADRRSLVIEQVKQHMADHLAEELTLTALAEMVALSPYHLNRLFRAAVGVPPMRYLRRMRANRAQALLHRRELKAAEVGRAVGYPTLQHFSRMFKQENGMTLRRFVREVVRQEDG